MAELKMNLKPLGDKVVVEVIDEPQTTASGIVLPDTAKEKSQRGKVLAVGARAKVVSESALAGAPDGQHLAALAIGLLFIVIQLLAWWGFLSVDWGVVQKTVDPLLESGSLNQAWRSLVTVMTYNIPFAAAFVPAMVLGIRRG